MERHLLPRFTSALAVLALSAALLSACGDGADPDPSPSAATESTTTVEPSTNYTIPPRPEDVHKPDEPDLSTVDINSAYELARYYLDLYPYVKATGDTTEWEKYAHPECEYCNTVIEAAVVENSSGAWADFNLGIVDEATFTATGDVDFRIDFLVERDEIVSHGPEGEVRTPPGEHSVVIGLKNVDGALKVRSFDILVPEVFGKEDLSS